MGGQISFPLRKQTDIRTHSHKRASSRREPSHLAHGNPYLNATKELSDLDLRKWCVGHRTTDSNASGKGLLRCLHQFVLIVRVAHWWRVLLPIHSRQIKWKSGYWDQLVSTHDHSPMPCLGRIAGQQLKPLVSATGASNFKGSIRWDCSGGSAEVTSSAPALSLHNGADADIEPQKN